MNREFEATLDQLQINKYNKVATDILSILPITRPEEGVSYNKHTFEFTPPASLVESQLNSILANNLIKFYMLLEDTAYQVYNGYNFYSYFYTNNLRVQLDFPAKLIRLSKGRARCSVKMSKLSTYKEIYDALVLTSSMK